MPLQFDYDRLIGEVRLDCNEPEAHIPNDDLIMQKAGDTAQLLVNELANAPPGWSQRYYDLPVQAGKGSYPLPIDKAFSKPVRVHTINPSNPYHVTRKVDFCDRQNVDEFYRGPRQALQFVGTHSARLMVISWDLAEPWIEVIPEPAEPAVYRVWYNTGLIPEALPDQNSPVPLEYFRYWRVKTALLVLRYCSWRGRDQEARAAEIKLLEPVLVGQVTEYKAAWNEFKLTNRVTGSQKPNGYAHWYIDDDPYL
jgi:hypothetical protein